MDVIRDKDTGVRIQGHNINNLIFTDDIDKKLAAISIPENDPARLAQHNNESLPIPYPFMHHQHLPCFSGIQSWVIVFNPSSDINEFAELIKCELLDPIRRYKSSVYLILMLRQRTRCRSEAPVCAVLE